MDSQLWSCGFPDLVPWIIPRFDPHGSSPALHPWIIPSSDPMDPQLCTPGSFPAPTLWIPSSAPLDPHQLCSPGSFPDLIPWILPSSAPVSGHCGCSLAPSALFYDHFALWFCCPPCSQQFRVKCHTWESRRGAQRCPGSSALPWDAEPELSAGTPGLLWGSPKMTFRHFHSPGELQNKLAGS